MKVYQTVKEMHESTMSQHNKQMNLLKKKNRELQRQLTLEQEENAEYYEQLAIRDTMLNKMFKAAKYVDGPKFD